jgi:hypothetical protein
MTYYKNQLRLERMQVDMQYHAAFNYWGLKGVIAERWAHGPVFGAWVDLGNQVTLTQGPSGTDSAAVGFYGLNTAGFNAEPVGNREQTQSNAAEWVGDVMEVLQPKRVTRLAVMWFAMHAVADPVGASKKLRDRYYQPDKLETLLPERDTGNFHNAVEIFLNDGPKQTSIVIGVIGPPHKGTYLSVPDADRDSRWWMGIRVHTVIFDEDNGVADPKPAVTDLMNESYSDLMHAVDQSFQSILS